MTIVGYLFSLPCQFFDTSTVPGEATPDDASAVAGRQLPAATAATTSARPAWRESGPTCLTCGIGITGPGFSNSAEQREHFKTDWHRYNVKRRLAKQPAVSEEQFERVLEQGTELSISGSESDSDSEEHEEAEDGGAALQNAGERRRRGQQQVATAIPRVTFQAPDGSRFSVWRCLLRQDHVKAPADQPSSAGELLGELRRLRGGAGCWVVVLLRGGHFAATVFKARVERPGGNTTTTNAKQQQHHDTDGQLEGFEVVAHKTFHRYVVRAKAGGKQSSKDATGKFARSAGSRLRRYNEVALERDIQELLASWSPHLAAADLIFVHAPASNARSLFSEGQTALLPSNPRLRRVPFVTHRPTFSETKRVLRLLCAVFRPEAAEQLLAEQQAAHAEEEARAEAEAAAAAAALAATHLGPGPSSPSPSAAPAPQQGPPDAAVPVPGASEQEQKAQQPDAGQDQASQQGSGSTAAAPVAGTGGVGAGGAAAAEGGPLHRAAKAGDPERVRRLLESGHDPCARDGRGRTPYAVAGDKDTRDAFRRFMAQQPDRWDYSTSGIPSPLTEEMEAAQLTKKAAHKAKLKAKDAERKATASGGKGEGGASGAGTGGKGSSAAAAAAAARSKAIEDEIALAAAEAAAEAARLNAASSKSSAPSGRGSGSSKVGGGGGGGGGKAGKAAGGGKGPAAAPAAAAAPPTPEELARRREMMAAAAEARMRALTQASQQQKLW